MFIFVIVFFISSAYGTGLNITADSSPEYLYRFFEETVLRYKAYDILMHEKTSARFLYQQALKSTLLVLQDHMGTQIDSSLVKDVIMHNPPNFQLWHDIDAVIAIVKDMTEFEPVTYWQNLHDSVLLRKEAKHTLIPTLCHVVTKLSIASGNARRELESLFKEKDYMRNEIKSNLPLIEPVLVELSSDLNRAQKFQADKFNRYNQIKSNLRLCRCYVIRLLQEESESSLPSLYIRDTGIQRKLFTNINLMVNDSSPPSLKKMTKMISRVIFESHIGKGAKNSLAIISLNIIDALIRQIEKRRHESELKTQEIAELTREVNGSLNDILLFK